MLKQPAGLQQRLLFSIRGWAWNAERSHELVTSSYQLLVPHLDKNHLRYLFFQKSEGNQKALQVMKLSMLFNI